MKPNAKPFAEVNDRTVYVAVYAKPARIYWHDGTREALQECESLDSAMREFAEVILSTLENAYEGEKAFEAV